MTGMDAVSAMRTGAVMTAASGRKTAARSVSAAELGITLTTKTLLSVTCSVLSALTMPTVMSMDTASATQGGSKKIAQSGTAFVTIDAPEPVQAQVLGTVMSVL